MNRRCEHRIDKLETYLPKADQIYERKILVFFIADPHNSNIPTSKQSKINTSIPLNEKDLLYAKRDDFKKSRFVTNSNEVDYSENEGDKCQEIKEVFPVFQDKKELGKMASGSKIMLSVKTLEGITFSNI